MALAVILGLVVGKPLGVTCAALAAVGLRVASLPDGVTWSAVHGCAWLAGIGFTMSLFIAALAFDGTTLLDSAKIGILAASMVSGLVGGVIVHRSTRASRETRPLFDLA